MPFIFECVLFGVTAGGVLGILVGELAIWIMRMYEKPEETNNYKKKTQLDLGCQDDTICAKK